MIKPLVIISAWMKVATGLSKPEHIRRAAICGGCSDKKYSRYLFFIEKKGKFKNINGFVCAKCHCPLAAKVRSDDFCEKWEKHTI